MCLRCSAASKRKAREPAVVLSAFLCLAAACRARGDLRIFALLSAADRRSKIPRTARTAEPDQSVLCAISYLYPQ